MRKIDQFKCYLLVVGILLFVLWLMVMAFLSGGRTTCIFDAFLNTSCLGCNTLKGMSLLKKGRVIEAFRANALSVIVPVGIGVLLINEIYRQCRRIIKHCDKESLLDKLIKKMFSGMKF